MALRIQPRRQSRRAARQSHHAGLGAIGAPVDPLVVDPLTAQQQGQLSGRVCKGPPMRRELRIPEDIREAVLQARPLRRELHPHQAQHAALESGRTHRERSP